jgi:hypothetical protein
VSHTGRWKIRKLRGGWDFRLFGYFGDLEDFEELGETRRNLPPITYFILADFFREEEYMQTNSDGL